MIIAFICCVVLLVTLWLTERPQVDQRERTTGLDSFPVPPPVGYDGPSDAPPADYDG